MIKILDKYKILEVIEDNNSSIICNAINIERNEKIILKLFDKDSYDEEDFNKLQENINSSNINKNVNLRKVYDVGVYSYNNTTYYAIELEHINGDTLDTIIENSIFDEEQGLEVIKQIIKGLSELHSIGIIYRNLTCKNIYLDINGVVKLDATGYISTKEKKENIVDASTDIYLLGTLFYKIMTKDTINIDDRPSYIDKEKFSTLAVSILEKTIYQDILYRYKSLNEFLSDIKSENNYILGNFEENNKQEENIVKSKKKYIKYIVGCIVLGIVFISVKALGNQSTNKVEKENEQTMVLNDEEEKIESDIEKEQEETVEEKNISEVLEESTLNDNIVSLNSNQNIQSNVTSSSNNQSRPATSSNSNSLGSTSSNRKPSSNSASRPNSNSNSNSGSNSSLGGNSESSDESNSESNSEQIKPEETPGEIPEETPEGGTDESPSETPDQDENQGSEDIIE